MQSKQYILFLSGLDKNVKEADLHRLFSEYPVSYIKIAKDHTTRESFGYAFVCIKNSANKAEEILKKFNYEKIPGYKKTLRICWYDIGRSGIKNKENFNIFVKKIPKEISHKEFHEYYSKFGTIVSLKLAEDDEGENMGYGFVMFETEEEADRAIKETHDKEFKGRKLWAGKFIKNKPKRPVEFNNIFVKNIPAEYSEKQVLDIFSKYGELGSCLIKNPKTDVDSKLPDDKKKLILSHKFGFICFKKADAAMKAIREVPFFKLKDVKYNDRLKSLAEKAKSYVPEEQLNRFAVYLIENTTDPEKIVSNETDIKEAINNFNELLKEFDGNYLIKDKEDRLECCQALKRHEREKKVKAVYEKIKRHIKEKYKLCNLYVKNLPDNYDDEAMRALFEQFGPIKSCKTIKKELVTSYLGIKRSVKVFGYVCFNEKQHAHEAKKALEGKSLSTNGAKLYVDYHQSKAERSEFLKLNMINKSAKNFNKGKMDMMPGPFGMPRGMPQSKFF
jgi:polyadenylate-binding protein